MTTTIMEGKSLMRKALYKKVKKSDFVIMQDPVDNVIMEELLSLREQNMRLKAYVEKSGIWAEMKEIVNWKPFDFLHYFCVQYQRKYRKEYKITGNIIHSYQRIETFMKLNKISNEDYKEFIDLAYSRHFTNNLIPNLGHIVNATLFNKLMSADVKKTKTQDWFDLDQTIQRENEDFEKNSNQLSDCTFIDAKLLREDASFRDALLTGCI